MNAKEKKCGGPCGLIKPLEEFHKQSRGKLGRAFKCKKCTADYGKNRWQRNKINPEFLAARRDSRRIRKTQITLSKKAYYEANKERILSEQKEFRDSNPKIIAARRKRHRASHREQLSAADRQYREAKGEVLLASKRVYRSKNKARINASNVRRKNIRRKTEPGFRLRMNLSCRVHHALTYQGVVKSETTMKLVGCTKAELMTHLQWFFWIWPGMAWNNYGSFWHVDHIRPCALYDLTDPEQQKACFHYTNLQPLPGPENLKKNAKYTPLPQ